MTRPIRSLLSCGFSLLESSVRQPSKVVSEHVAARRLPKAQLLPNNFESATLTRLVGSALVQRGRTYSILYEYISFDAPYKNIPRTSLQPAQPSSENPDGEYCKYGQTGVSADEPVRTGPEMAPWRVMQLHSLPVAPHLARRGELVVTSELHINSPISRASCLVSSRKLQW